MKTIEEQLNSLKQECQDLLGLSTASDQPYNWEIETYDDSSRTIFKKKGKLDLNEFAELEKSIDECNNYPELSNLTIRINNGGTQKFYKRLNFVKKEEEIASAPSVNNNLPFGLNAAAWEMFGRAFLNENGLGNTFNDAGMSGVLLQAQKTSIEHDFKVKSLLDENLKIKAENENLKVNISDLEKEIKKLEKEYDNLVEKYEKVAGYASKGGAVVEIGTKVLTGVLGNYVASNPTLAGLLGFTQPQQEPQQEQQDAPTPQIEENAEENENNEENKIYK